MEDEETEKIEGMVAPKPSFVPRKMQMGGEPAAGAAAAGAAGAPPAAKKVEVVYTPASDALLEVGWCDDRLVARVGSAWLVLSVDADRVDV